MQLFLSVLLALSLTAPASGPSSIDGLPVNQDAAAAEEIIAGDLHTVVLTAPLSVTKDYTPELRFYCTTSETGLDTIYDVQLYRASGDTSKTFGGDIQVWLCDENTVEYVINGDFCSDGVMYPAAFLEGDIQKGGTGSVSFSVVETPHPDHYQYFYDHKAVTYPG